MIKLYISPEGIQGIALTSGSDVMEDVDWTTWKSIRPIVNTLNHELKLAKPEAKKSGQEEQNDHS